ncbi:nuclease-related domain-containing DEAD/DEAH box helicase [Xylanibacter brevis]|uniref:nuclease-related domain-containing DEAD/DEAH box helicase n=1 Tax=Xylanibacter brevis TaxID=83231 RepID=UPI0004807B04|nr:NERD domain-containing protein [Xylanibacter brevis]
MAKLYPPIEVIKKRKPAATPGERALLSFLLHNYDDEYEIFFQPFLNGDLPDVIVMHKGCGVMVFEVKDWDLSNYNVSSSGKWIVKANGAVNKNTPLRQVLRYKEKLYDLHIDSLLNLRLKDFKYWYVVNCAVYFHCSTTKEANDKCNGELLCDSCHVGICKQCSVCQRKMRNCEISANRSIEQEKCRKYKTWVDKNFTILGNDALNKATMDRVFDERWISRRSRYFSEDLYNSFVRILRPSFHTMEDGMDIKLSKEQELLAKSTEGERKRIKGVAGSGKTLVLAQRAVNAHKRTQGQVLILTFNITLRNYIHDKISQVREEFAWEFFNISNYHDFITSNMNNVGIDFDFLETDEEGNRVFMNDRVAFERLADEKIYSNLHLFDGHIKELPKYDVILIDETQDYKENWIRIIKDNFATDNAEIVAFADEKQNIYSRTLDVDKMPVIPIQSGPWDKKLNKSYRLSKKIALLVSDFQKKYFAQKYIVENQIETDTMLSLFDEPYIEYHYYEPTADEMEDKNLAKYIYSQILKHSLNSNDVTILSSRIRMLRSLDYMLRKESKENTNIMFETREEFIKVFPNSTTGLEKNSEIEKIRKNRKANFWMNRGTIKLSTIHSFKGWESPALFLVIEDSIGSNAVLNNQLQPVEFSDELVYTGLTRCQNYLFIINLGNQVYHDYFSNSILIDKKVDASK